MVSPLLSERLFLLWLASWRGSQCVWLCALEQISHTWVGTGNIWGHITEYNHDNGSQSAHFFLVVYKSSGFSTLCLPLLHHSFLRAHPIPRHTTRLWQNLFLQGNVPLLPWYHQPEKKTPNISQHLISSKDKSGLKSNQLCLVINPEWDNSIKATETNMY